MNDTSTKKAGLYEYPVVTKSRRAEDFLHP